MKNARIAIATICLLWTAVAPVHTGEAATTFAGAIVGVDQAKRTITFQTRDGQIWTFPVADHRLLKREHAAKGDQVMIEIDVRDRITKIAKISKLPRMEHSLSESIKSLYDARP